MVGLYSPFSWWFPLMCRPLCILWWSWVSCPCRGPRWTWARWDDQGNAKPSPEETWKLPLWCQTTSCILLVLPKAQKRCDTVTLILTSFWNAFCVSSSKRISSFMTITSPVSLWVTCYNSYMWVNLKLFLEIDPLSDNYNKVDAGAPIFTICMLESQKLNVNHNTCGQTWPSDTKCFRFGRHHVDNVGMTHSACSDWCWNTLCLTLMACPKQPLPSTSPWMRSDGRKMRCVLLDTTRSDSDRLMFFWLELGDLSML